MLSLNEIKKFYPGLQGFERSVLREHLQYKILDIIFKSEYGRKMSFLGGTSIRICHGGFRFSEDLDFDNIDLSKEDFEKMSEVIKKELEYLGYNIEVKNIFKGAFHSYIKFSDILYNEGISPNEDEKIMIQVDTVKKTFDYKAESFLLSRFDVFRKINITPIDVVLSQKVGAVFGRKRPKGRDFYDISYLLSRTDFNFQYLKEALSIEGKIDLKQKLLKKVDEINLKQLSVDVQPFLINPDDIERVLSFREFIEQKL